MGLGAGAAHVSADALSGSITSGHAVYAGHARLWQGDSVLDADRIELWRDDKHLLATGHVVAVSRRQGGPLAQVLRAVGRGASKAHRQRRAGCASDGAGAIDGSGPALWKVVAPSLAYWSDQGKARLEGGVLASSERRLARIANHGRLPRPSAALASALQARPLGQAASRRGLGEPAS